MRGAGNRDLRRRLDPTVEVFAVRRRRPQSRSRSHGGTATTSTVDDDDDWPPPDGNSGNAVRVEEILLFKGRLDLDDRTEEAGGREEWYRNVELEKVAALDIDALGWSDPVGQSQREEPRLEVRLGDSFTLQTFPFHFSAPVEGTDEDIVMICDPTEGEPATVRYLFLLAGPFGARDHASILVDKRADITWNDVLGCARRRPGL